VATHFVQISQYTASPMQFTVALQNYRAGNSAGVLSTTYTERTRLTLTCRALFRVKPDV